MPRIIEVELLDDLVGICAPGDDVTVVGIIKVGSNFYSFVVENNLYYSYHKSYSFDFV